MLTPGIAHALVRAVSRLISTPRRRMTRATLCLCALALAACTSPQESGVKVIVGARLETMPYSVIVIANGKIAAVGPQADVPVPKGAEITRGIGKTVSGHITPGEPADLVLQDAATGRTEMTMRNGEWLK